MTIETKRKRIEEKIRKLEEELKQLQLNCPHNNHTKQYRGSTGNYDPHNDCYWIEYHCQDCDKQWSTPQ
jgi:hypothetical protein